MQHTYTRHFMYIVKVQALRAHLTRSLPRLYRYRSIFILSGLGLLPLLFNVCQVISCQIRD